MQNVSEDMGRRDFLKISALMTGIAGLTFLDPLAWFNLAWAGVTEGKIKLLRPITLPSGTSLSGFNPGSKIVYAGNRLLCGLRYGYVVTETVKSVPVPGSEQYLRVDGGNTIFMGTDGAANFSTAHKNPNGTITGGVAEGYPTGKTIDQTYVELPPPPCNCNSTYYPTSKNGTKPNKGVFTVVVPDSSVGTNNNIATIGADKILTKSRVQGAKSFLYNIGLNHYVEVTVECADGIHLTGLMNNGRIAGTVLSGGKLQGFISKKAISTACGCDIVNLKCDDIVTIEVPGASATVVTGVDLNNVRPYGYYVDAKTGRRHGFYADIVSGKVAAIHTVDDPNRKNTQMVAMRDGRSVLVGTTGKTVNYTLATLKL